MVHISRGSFSIRPECMTEAIQIISEARDFMRKDYPKCFFVSVGVEIGENKVLFYEEWEDAESVAEIMASPTMNELMSRIMKLVSEVPPDWCLYQAVIVDV